MCWLHQKDEIKVLKKGDIVSQMRGGCSTKGWGGAVKPFSSGLVQISVPLRVHLPHNPQRSDRGGASGAGLSPSLAAPTTPGGVGQGAPTALPQN